MEETINELIDIIMKRMGKLSYDEQHTVYDHLSEWCRTQSDTAMKMEYMIDEMDSESMNEF